MIHTPDLRSGDWVEVRSPAEISATLDADGTLDGLPFMPEMIEYCGRRFRVQRKAEKTCREGTGGAYDHREFLRNDVVVLEGGLRCPGTDHDGCQRACMLFWKMAWLRKVENGAPATTSQPSGHGTLRSKLKTKIPSGRYFCQSTELVSATKPLPSWQRLLKCWYEVRFGTFGVLKMMALIVAPQWRKLVRKFVGERRLLGTLVRTPVESIGLRPGDIVEIKSPQEIAQTLDQKGRNRGLLCDSYAVRRFGGRRVRVRNRLDRMILESTGEMREMQNTVILEDVCCDCPLIVGGCPRRDPAYWREIWLRRVEGTDLRDARRPRPQPT